MPPFARCCTSCWGTPSTRCCAPITVDSDSDLPGKDSEPVIELVENVSDPDDGDYYEKIGTAGEGFEKPVLATLSGVSLSLVFVCCCSCERQVPPQIKRKTLRLTRDNAGAK